MAKNYLIYSEQLATDIELLCQIIKAPSNTLFQIRKSSSSVYANIREANYGQNKADMLSKFEIALKECSETEGWLQLLYNTNGIDEETYRGYNEIMREHLSNEDNFHDIEATFCSYKEADDRIYLYVSVEDKSAFDPSEANSEEIRLELVGDNCNVLSEALAKEEICEGDSITVKCSMWVYMDSSFYYVAEIKKRDKILLSFDDGLKNIVTYINDNKSLL